MIRVKICGLNSEASVEAAVEAGADWLGFVFFARSPRYVTPPRAAALASRRKGISCVGLFVGASDDDIAATLDVVALDILQLYDEPARIDTIRARFGLPVWRALGVSRAADLPGEAGADALLVEPRPPAGAGRPGGNAVSLDWPMLAGWRPAFPWALAGGLTPDNVGRAIEESGAVGVDVSSGVESALGVKSPALVRAFVRAARAADGFLAPGPAAHVPHET